MKKLRLPILPLLFIFTTLVHGQIFQPQSKAELQTAVNLWVDDNDSALAAYG